MQSIQFYYKKRVVYQTAIVGALLSLIFLYKTFHVALRWDILLYGSVSLLLLLILFLFIRKYFIPAFRSKVAIELNKNGILAYGGTRVVKWGEIENIVPVKQFLFGKYSSIAIDLHYEKGYFNKLTFAEKSDALFTKLLYRTPIVIPLRMIDYDSEEVFLTFQDYFKKIKGSGQAIDSEVTANI